MKRNRTIVAACMALLLLSATACASIKLSDAYDEATVKAKAEEIVADLNGGDYEAVAAMAREDIADQLTADIIGAAVEGQLSSNGAFREIKEIAIGGTQSNGHDYALAVVLCTHEGGSVKYAITFDTDLSIAGLYIK